MAKTEIIRKSFGLKDEIEPQLRASYHSPLIEKIKEGHNRYEAGRISLHLAKEFGFCYGVDRAIDYAYETRAKFPDKRIFLTSEIIHNPQVNANLKKMGIQFLTKPTHSSIPLDDIRKDDVVIIPAFGTTMKELDQLQERGCVLVDTTCGSVMSVWKRVESYARDSFTSVIHGKYEHEETCATSSRAVKYEGGKYLIVKDKEEAQRVCDYIRKGGDREVFLKRFSKSVSKNFDPNCDLGHVGCANQTTMLSSESMDIANMLQEAIRERYGEEELPKRFRHFDTICSATQERQDAVIELLQEKPDLMIVIGGFNSSNTGHLVEMSLAHCPAYHVKGPECILSADEIEHKKAFSSEIIRSKNWLPPEGKIKMGVTAGASTPNRVIEDVVERIIKIAG